MKTLKAIVPVFVLLSTALYGADSEVQFLPKDAIIEGTMSRAAKPERISDWRRKEDLLKLRSPDLEAGEYSVILEYSAAKGFGGKISISLNGQLITTTLKETGGWEFPEKKKLSRYRHKGGPLDVVITQIRQEKENRAILDFYSLRLENP